jgi:hypothetical protein
MVLPSQVVRTYPADTTAPKLSRKPVGKNDSTIFNIYGTYTEQNTIVY